MMRTYQLKNILRERGDADESNKFKTNSQMRTMFDKKCQSMGRAETQGSSQDMQNQNRMKNGNEHDLAQSNGRSLSQVDPDAQLEHVFDNDEPADPVDEYVNIITSGCHVVKGFQDGTHLEEVWKSEGQDAESPNYYNDE